MKKFVAIVLALALALSLCTVAFAKTNSDGTVSSTTVSYKKATLNAFAEDASGMTEYLANDDIDGITKTTTTGRVHDDKPVYVADKYTVGLVGTTTDLQLYAVSKDVADGMLVIDGAKVYVTSDPVSTEKVFTKYVEAPDKVACGAYTTETAAPYTADALVDVYVTADGDAFIDDDDTNDTWGWYNNGFVKYTDEEAETVKHVFDLDKKDYFTTDTTGKVVSGVCTECKKSFKVVKAAGLDKEWKLDVNYMAADVVGGTQYYAVLDDAVAGSASTTTVDSSKTFDAGVAMYVGLSLMSVAGSAVVIGKKKEF